MQLKAIKQITGIINVVTGLHIGAGKDSLEIGGLDQPIIKHPLTGEPYIPGSSIKGKMRALLEISRYMGQSEATREFVMGKKDKNGRGLPCGCGCKGCPACTIFGTSAASSNTDLGPTRLVVRDAYLTGLWKAKHMAGELAMEIKYENTIDRVKGTAEHPRPLERVPAGVAFDLNLSFKVFDGDAPELLNDVFCGLRLIELDALGGNASRGCGQVQFADLQCDRQPVDLTQHIL